MSAGREPKGLRRQRGIALLLAILLVAIATILASAIGYAAVKDWRRALYFFFAFAITVVVIWPAR